MNKNCTLLVCSCDGYSDLWDVFYQLLFKYWKDLPYEIVMSTESKDYYNLNSNIRMVHPSDTECSWTERISDALKKINTDNVILILDDFFLFDHVKTEKVNNCLNWMASDKSIACFTFWPVSYDGLDCSYEDFELRPPVARYKVSAILGLWNKKYLLKYMDGYKENAWEFEVNGTARSNTLYKNDKFYIMQDIRQYIFPYDFTKYGLFCGKWFKDNIELFKKQNIKFDFSKRGFYEEALRGNAKSIIASFSLDSKLIANYELNNKHNKMINCNNVIKNGKFVQKYNINNSKDIIRWEPSTQWGFALNNVKFTATYKNGINEVIPYNRIYGNFVLQDEKIFFNSTAPYVHIELLPNKRAFEICISGNLVYPLTSEQLEKTFNKITKPNSKYQASIGNHIFYEFLHCKEKINYVRMNSQINFFDNKNNIINSITPERIIKSGKFIQEYVVPKNAKTFYWSPSSSSGYGISKFNIFFKYKDNDNLVKCDDIRGLPKEVYNMYCFVGNYTPSAVFKRKKPKVIIITGEFICPIPIKNLKKIFYDKRLTNINKNYFQTVGDNIMSLPDVFAKQVRDVFK